MDTNWYVAMVRETDTIAAFFFDQTGGKWTLALLCETLENLLSANNVAGVTTVIQKLYEAANQAFTWADQVNAERGALFIDALIDALSANTTNIT